MNAILCAYDRDYRQQSKIVFSMFSRRRLGLFVEVDYWDLGEEFGKNLFLCSVRFSGLHFDNLVFSRERELCFVGVGVVRGRPLGCETRVIYELNLGFYVGEY